MAPPTYCRRNWRLSEVLIQMYSSTDAINAMKSSASNLGSSAYYGAGIPNLENLVSEDTC